MRLKNRVGLIYGMLTVIKRHGVNTSNHVTWECLCECGKKTIVTGNNLKSGGTKSCGCLKDNPPKNIIDIVGDKYGRLTVLSESKRENNIAYWDCLCECGNKTIATTGKLRSGHKKSCGCLKSEAARDNAYKNLAGKKKISENGSLPKRKAKDGYVKIHDREHPRSDKGGFVFEHIKVMENKIGRRLIEKENVHHINGDKGDNKPENLELWSTSQPPGQRVWQKAKHYLSFLIGYKFDFDNLTIDDLKKARWYIDRELAKREK